MNTNLEHVPCDLCGNDRYKVRYRKPDIWLFPNQFEYPIVECRNCGLVYVNPRPTSESMRHFYPHDYHDDRDTEDEFKRYEIQLGYLPSLSNEKILDIGCARGDFLDFIHRKHPNIQAYGIDYYSEKSTYQHIHFRNTDLIERIYEDRFFDIVMSWAVFEHLHTPGLYFNEVARILKADGKFVILVTNSESLYGRHAYAEDIPRHTYHYSEHTLRQYGEQCGLILEKVEYSDDIFDGRGHGVFKYFFARLLRIDWENIYHRNTNLIGKLLMKLGGFLDFIVFYTHWEKKLRRSGIMIATFKKK